jgi:hypothetical protein
MDSSVEIFAAVAQRIASLPAGADRWIHGATVRIRLTEGIPQRGTAKHSQSHSKSDSRPDFIDGQPSQSIEQSTHRQIPP